MGKDVCCVVLGYLLCGGSLMVFDCVVVLCFGVVVVWVLEVGCSDVMVLLMGVSLMLVLLVEVVGCMKCVLLDGDMVVMVCELGICLGD